MDNGEKANDGRPSSEGEEETVIVPPKKNDKDDKPRSKSQQRGLNRRGRIPGSKNETTLVREDEERKTKQRFMRGMEKVLSSHLSLARGIQYLYRIDRHGKEVVHVQVTDPDEIREALEAIEQGQHTDRGDGFYYITVKSPNILAIKEIYDRVFGSVKQKVEVEGEVVHTHVEVTEKQHERIIREEFARLTGGTGQRGA